jgi:hypothetical protein
MPNRKRPIVIKYEGDDQITHTIERPICQDDSCVCAIYEYELLLQETAKPVKQQRTRRTLVDWSSESDKAQLNNRQQGFRLLR